MDPMHLPVLTWSTTSKTVWTELCTSQSIIYWPIWTTSLGLWVRNTLWTCFEPPNECRPLNLKKKEQWQQAMIRACLVEIEERSRSLRVLTILTGNLINWIKHTVDFGPKVIQMPQALVARLAVDSHSNITKVFRTWVNKILWNQTKVWWSKEAVMLLTRASRTLHSLWVVCIKTHKF